MGNWHLSIEGIGAHHNHDNPGDADRLAKIFVKVLTDAGQTINKATFTHGGSESLNPIPTSGSVTKKES
jgi:hypothetical protein